VSRLQLSVSHRIAQQVTLMPDYAFHFKNGELEDHVVDLPDDAAAIWEALGTASGMLRELEMSVIGQFSQFLEIREQGETILQIEVHAKRSR
jgi:hypothetical protein